MSDHPHLTLVDPNADPQIDEFAPLPYFPWDCRPDSVPLSQDEAATAIHLANAHLPQAALLLKTPLHRLTRLVKHSPRLQRVLEETSHVVVAKAFSKYIEALDSPEDRRQEWGATKIMQSRAAIGHLFSPAPANSTTSNASLTVNPNRTITFRWRTADDPDPNTP